MDAFLSKAGESNSSTKVENERIASAKDNFTKKRRAFSPSNKDSIIWASNLMKKVNLLNSEF